MHADLYSHTFPYTAVPSFIVAKPSLVDEIRILLKIKIRMLSKLTQ